MLFQASSHCRSLRAPLAPLRFRLLLGHRQHRAIAELGVAAAGCLNDALCLDEHHQVPHLRQNVGWRESVAPVRYQIWLVQTYLT